MYSTYVFCCCLIFIRTRDITTPKRNFSGEAVEALAHQSGLSVVNHSPLRGWHHDASNLKWTANKSRELIWFFQVRPYPTSVITQSAWTKLDTHTHTHFYNAQGPESTCNIVMGVDLSGWLLGDCPKKSQKQIPSPDRCGNNATPSICQGLHRVTVFTPPGEQDYQLNITGLCLGTFH